MTQILFRDFSIDFEDFPQELYVGTKKQWSNNGIELSSEFVKELENIVNIYLRVMGLDQTLFPARVDIGFSQDMNPIIYEVTTGFVDQIGSCLALQDGLGNTNGLVLLEKTPFESSFLTESSYLGEYNLMRDYFFRAGLDLSEDEGLCFVYGYPNRRMKSETRYIPGWRGLDAEEKLTQTKVLTKLCESTTFVIPRVFENSDTYYEELPDEIYSRLVFKQIYPKIKGSRQSILFGKGKLSRERYEAGEMLAQEYIPPFRSILGYRYEMKALFMPTEDGNKFLGAYTLIDEKGISRNFGSTSIPNDAFPQGPVLIS